MDVTIYDPGFHVSYGHHYNANYFLKGELSRRGLTTRLLVSSKLHGEVAAPLEAEPILRADPYAAHGGDAITAPLESYLGVAINTVNALNGITGLLCGPRHLFVMHSVNAGMLFGTSLWVAQHLADALPTIVAQLQTCRDVDERRRKMGIHGVLWRHAAQRLGMLLGSTVHLIAVPGLGPKLSFAVGRPIAEAPFMTPGSSVRGSNGRSRFPPKLVFLGHAKMERGFGLTPDIIAACQARRPCGVVVHVAGADLRSAEAQLAIQRLRAMAGEGRIEMLEQALSLEAYYQVLGDADVVVLPYDALSYQSPSGIMNEAIAVGKPVVVPDSPLYLGQAALFGAAAVGFDAFKCDPVSEAIGVALDRLDELTERAGAAAERWWARHGTARFVDHILSFRPAAREAVAS